jgi:hypothetical protein
MWSSGILYLSNREELFKIPLPPAFHSNFQLPLHCQFRHSYHFSYTYKSGGDLVEE